MEALHHHQRAIDFNNLGLSQWDSGEGLGAIEYLFSAYRHCLKSFSYPESTIDRAENPNFSVNAAMETSLKAMGEKQQLPNVVMDRGIFIPSGPEVFNNPSGANMSMVLCAIVFNLAVVHHLATKWGDVEIQRTLRAKFQRTAVDFYQTGLRLQQECSSCGMYTIVLLNNLSHLYAALGESERAAFYFSEMLSRISALEEAIMGEFDAYGNKLHKIGSSSAAPAA